MIGRATTATYWKLWNCVPFHFLVEELHALLIDEGNVLKELALTCRAEARILEKSIFGGCKGS
jgi:hypothetical protein